ncbi:DUF1003 domain-containing protein [Rivularia sp. UHCC 0363]|uniref:DUF1003 domain-containing protein n=1 Tax=Rivularia sp. UHCC 0363 TaxID=3110244 RepID=UPI002B218CCC|nr:DUF1003 domain-containing protein [Rivularia sp. UHCC 0363]MEA5595974.1 DUF1003 domain-containing protein [Rivularia sp. UHCC 0363]
MMKSNRHLRARVSPEEYKLLVRLRERKPAQHPPSQQTTKLGDRVADTVAAVMGSWRFIIIQSVLLFFWVVLNIVAFSRHWDPYPFILLNLMLSFQAAYAAPIIMMSQNRQSAIDRQDAKYDYEVNKKAELEIELMHDKLNQLREQQIVEVVQMLKEQQQRLANLEELLKQLRNK